MAKEDGASGKQPTHTAEFIKTDVDRVRFYDDPMTDNLVTAFLALATETWALRRRTLVLERVLESKGVTAEMIETFAPTEADEADWQRQRDQFVETVMGPLAREAELPVSSSWPKES